MTHHTRGTATLATIAALAGATMLLTACTTSPATPAPSSEPHETSSEAGNERLAVSYEGGIAVLNAQTLEVVQEFPSEEFTRLNPFGDDKSIAVTTASGFQILDTETPKLTDLVFQANTPGHVVPHAGKTVLYDDGTGKTSIIDTDAFAAGYGALPDAQSYRAKAAHHGVSIVLADGTLVTTLGDESSRSGAVVLHPHDDHWHEEASNTDCPGVHGEATTSDETVVLGCENGALIYQDGKFTKLSAPDAYGRSGNMFAAPGSPVVVGDYKNDPDAEGYLLGAVALVDTEAKSFEVVQLPSAARYTFRDLARGPENLAYILATDGQIHVLDPASGDIVNAFKVIAPWSGPANWQDPHPAIKVAGSIAYVTEPATNTVHAVDLETGEVIISAKLAHTPNEIAVA